MKLKDEEFNEIENEIKVETSRSDCNIPKILIKTTLKARKKKNIN
jgi:hypothetical protein